MIQKKKTKTAYYCSQCGAEHPRWQGQCKECSEWNSLIEERVVNTKKIALDIDDTIRPCLLPDISTENLKGYHSNINEFDRVLGGQLLPGSAILIGGEPGIGKSTLLLQAAEAYSIQGMNVAYVSGEESPAQLKQRAQRLNINGDNITVISATIVEDIINIISNGKYQIVLIDSIQTTSSSTLDSPPGTVAQIRESAYQLILQARSKNYALFMVGHVTKDGNVAGPKLLEHMVDTVIYFEGDNSHLYRILRATKNRFGAVSEIGLFEMMTEGLVEVTNPSSLFLTDRDNNARTGSVVTAICEGQRPILVEIQALVTPTNYGTPQRVAGGIDNKRLALLLAILEKKCGYPMGNNDVFVSVAGGLKLTEPVIDLPMMAAIVSSLLNKSIGNDVILIGEVGLSGEVRGITMIEQRIKEAKNMGFKTVIAPESNSERFVNDKIKIIGASQLQQALDILFN